MKRHLLLSLLVLMSIPAWAAEWKLVWSDEFDEPGLPNPAKWDYETGFIRNLAIGGAWGGQKGIDDTIFPQRYCIDYVRVYQKPAAK
jgi:hypothetical protein